MRLSYIYLVCYGTFLWITTVKLKVNNAKPKDVSNSKNRYTSQYSYDFCWYVIIYIFGHFALRIQLNWIYRWTFSKWWRYDVKEIEVSFKEDFTHCVTVCVYLRVDLRLLHGPTHSSVLCKSWCKSKLL